MTDTAQIARTLLFLAEPMLKGLASEESKRLFAEWAAAAERLEFAAGTIFAEAVCAALAEEDVDRRAAWRAAVHALALVLKP